MNMEYKRNLDLQTLVEKRSLFLFGPRATGKSTLIQATFPDAHIYDLLERRTFQRLMKNPEILGEETGSDGKIVVIDEIQKMPLLLDEVQRLMQRKKKKFLLTGSSARKLKRGASNLLAGRAWDIRLYPLNSREIDDFDLLQYLNRGGLPAIYQSEHFERDLQNYVGLYLQEEIFAEALSRNFQAFAEFLELAALSSGEEINFESFSRDTGLSPNTIKNHFQVLEDTLVGSLVPPFVKTKKRKAISRSKFYFFDVGVINSLAHRGEIQPKSELFGKAFEQFIFQELRAANSYVGKNAPLQYWRSTSQFEVDFILGRNVAIEVKATEHVNDAYLRGLRALKEEGLIAEYVVVSMDRHKRTARDGIEILPWPVFLDDLWSGRWF